MQQTLKKLMKETLAPIKTTKSPTSKPGKTPSNTETPRERHLTLSADKTDKAGPQTANKKERKSPNKPLPEKHNLILRGSKVKVKTHQLKKGNF
ncbi:hypothetical protein KEJ43_02695 [Candidatus Bathyarchaeota archaeon]|nr:hypothetical protein [Candidatus Bathyarchaeota archaeon]